MLTTTRSPLRANGDECPLRVGAPPVGGGGPADRRAYAETCRIVGRSRLDDIFGMTQIKPIQEPSSLPPTRCPSRSRDSFRLELKLNVVGCR
jgi:hypothetical protein